MALLSARQRDDDAAAWPSCSPIAAASATETERGRWGGRGGAGVVVVMVNVARSQELSRRDWLDRMKDTGSSVLVDIVAENVQGDGIRVGPGRTVRVSGEEVLGRRGGGGNRGGGAVRRDRATAGAER